MTRSSCFNPLRSSAAAALVLTGAMIAAACSDNTPPVPAPVTETAVKPPDANARVQTYKDCWRAFNTQAWDQFAQCYADNAVSENIDSTPPSATGPAAIIARGKLEAAAFPDRKGDVQLILANGDHIMSIALYTGTNTGPMPPGPDGKSMPATNKKIGLYIAHSLQWDSAGAKAAKDAAYVEEGTLMAQLGVIPNPKARKAMAAPAGTLPTVVIGQNDEKERNNLGVMQNMLEAGNKHDLKAIDGFMADDYKLIEVGQPKDMNKKEAMVGTKEFFTGFPDITVTPSAKWTAGDYVVLEGSISGTNKGAIPSMGIAKATNKPFTGRFIEVMKFDNNKLKEDWLFYNAVTMAAQLGLMK